MGEFFDKAKGEVSNATHEPNNADQVVSESPAVTTAASAALDPSSGIPSPCDNTAPGSHVEAACHGPTADNPSLSIQKRLKRARFFDQRELLVAAGEAEPMETDAGLPDALEVPEAPQE